MAGTLTAQPRSANCANPSAQADLDVNGIRARITNSGRLWNDGANAIYEVPPGGGSPGANPANAIFTGNLWIGGKDPGGGLKIAAGQYNVNAYDFYPGPLTDEGGTETDVCAKWDKLFPIKRSEVEDFLAAYDPQDPPTTGIIAENIAGWPGRGNPLLEAVHGFSLSDDTEEYAPFQDVNEDGIYNPLDGDYPLFCGDQAIWGIFNDAGGVHAGSNTAVSVQAEIHLMAYAFASDDSVLHRTTFYDYRIINRGRENLSDFYAGHWIDSDLGCFDNDLNNSLPEDNLFYVYNNGGIEPENCDGVAGYGLSTPVNIFQVVHSSAGDNRMMSSFINTYNNSVGAPPLTTSRDATNALEYYNLLTGSWTDGTPLTRGGIGYETTGDTTRFAFDGGMVNGRPWEHCGSVNGQTDLRQVYGTGPYNLAPGERAAFTLAVTTVFGVDYPTDLCPNTDQVRSAAGTVKDFYDGNCSPSALTNTRTPAAPASIGLEVFPNPTAGALTFRLPATTRIAAVEVLDLAGRRLTALGGTGNELNLDLRATGLAPGVYVYRLRTATGVVVAGRVVLVE